MAHIKAGLGALDGSPPSRILAAVAEPSTGGPDESPILVDGEPGYSWLPVSYYSRARLARIRLSTLLGLGTVWIRCLLQGQGQRPARQGNRSRGSIRQIPLHGGDIGFRPEEARAPRPREAEPVTEERDSSHIATNDVLGHVVLHSESLPAQLLARRSPRRMSGSTQADSRAVAEGENHLPHSTEPLSGVGLRYTASGTRAGA